MAEVNDNTEALPPFDDPRVQAAYRVLCEDAVPPAEEHWEGYAARRIVAALAQQAATPTGDTLSGRLQQRCVDWGTYWRAPDAHGVNLTTEQATELLRDALGVEVEIAAARQGATPTLTDQQIDALAAEHAHETFSRPGWFALSLTGLRALVAAARQAATPAPAEPPTGWKLVPVVPTIEMRVAGRDAAKKMRRVDASIGMGMDRVRYDRPADHWDKVRAAWDAMLDAAPPATPAAPPAAQAEPVARIRIADSALGPRASFFTLTDAGRGLPNGAHDLFAAAPTPAAQAGGALPLTLRELFCQALAWGNVYGPVIASHQWDEMRDKMAAQFTEQARAALKGQPEGLA